MENTFGIYDDETSNLLQSVLIMIQNRGIEAPVNNTQLVTY